MAREIPRNNPPKAFFADRPAAITPCLVERPICFAQRSRPWIGSSGSSPTDLPSPPHLAAIVGRSVRATIRLVTRANATANERAPKS